MLQKLESRELLCFGEFSLSDCCESKITKAAIAAGISLTATIVMEGIVGGLLESQSCNFIEGNESAENASGWSCTAKYYNDQWDSNFLGEVAAISAYTGVGLVTFVPSFITLYAASFHQNRSTHDTLFI